MKPSFSQCTWGPERLGELLTELAGRHGLSSERVKNPPSSREIMSPENIGRWIETACEWLGIEAQAITVAHPEVEDTLRRSAPAVLRCPMEGQVRYLALVKARGRRVAVLGPDGRVLRVPVARVRAWLCERLERPLEAEVGALLEATRVPRKRAERARRAILGQRLAASRLGGVWLLQAGPGAPIRAQLAQARISLRLGALVVAHTVQYGLWVGSWWVIGLAALQGRIDVGLFSLWSLMVLSLVPLRMATTWLQGSISIRGGALLKQRLLAGALRLSPEEIRHQGSGQLLARVLESEALESLALSGGFLTLLGGIELLIAVGVLVQGAGGWLHGLILLGWILVAVLAGRRYLARRTVWTNERLELTSTLVESMLGYRTRLAQEPREQWHDNEDRQLEGYYRASGQLDRSATILSSVVCRGWMIVGIAGLGPVLVAGADSPALMAVSLGGILLAFRALGGFTNGMAQLYGASIAWRQASSLFRAAARLEPRSDPDLVLYRAASKGRSLLEAQAVSFSYEGRPEPVLRNCDLSIKEGERILLQGPSGAGKSTFASLLAGLRSPSSGLMLLRGLDLASAGSRFWRQSVVLAPQFHENHILNESLAFNVLLGREWPPRPQDLEDAEELCRQLGLGDMLDRMPSGMFQMVGETGWQLSHGERSRVFIARTLMQEHDVTILDESFGGLDGESVLESAEVLLKKARTVAVIGHS